MLSARSFPSAKSDMIMVLMMHEPKLYGAVKKDGDRTNSLQIRRDKGEDNKGSTVALESSVRLKV